jgi:hypothetical protein
MLNSQSLRNLNSLRAGKLESSPELLCAARRTAFVSRFIVLREGRRSRAHREIEELVWEANTTAEELHKLFRQCFINNGDKLTPVDRDLNRALEHAETSATFFLDQYVDRMTLSFHEALLDYERSNCLLFGDDSGSNAPRKGGWRLP